jgi:hypothetical protein
MVKRKRVAAIGVVPYEICFFLYEWENPGIYKWLEILMFFCRLSNNICVIYVFRIGIPVEAMGRRCLYIGINYMSNYCLYLDKVPIRKHLV